MEVRAGYKQTDIGVIPQDWTCTTVMGIASSIRNAIVGGPFGSDLVSNDYIHDGVPVIRGQNMGLQWISGEFVFVSHAKANSLEANLAHPNDLVFTQRGTLGQVSLVPAKPFNRYLISQSQMKLTVNRHTADPRFFYYVFCSGEQQKYIRLNTIQTGVPHINLGILRNIPIPLPPTKAEQEAIADALSNADALIESLEQLIAKKHAIKQGAMQELLRPKAGWVERRLGDIFSLSAGRSKSGELNHGGKFVVMDMGAVSTDGKILATKRTNTERDMLNCGDLVMPKDDIGGGQIIGKVAYIETDNAYVLGDHVYRLRRYDADMATLFFYFLINSYHVNRELKTKVTGSAQLGLGRSSVLEQILIYPEDLKEQAEIANTLQEMDAEIAALEAQRDKMRQVKQGMMQELLTGRIRLEVPPHPDPLPC